MRSAPQWLNEFVCVGVCMCGGLYHVNRDIVMYYEPAVCLVQYVASAREIKSAKLLNLTWVTGFNHCNDFTLSHYQTHHWRSQLLSQMWEKPHLPPTPSLLISFVTVDCCVYLHFNLMFSLLCSPHKTTDLFSSCLHCTSLEVDSVLHNSQVTLELNLLSPVINRAAHELLCFL